VKLRQDCQTGHREDLQGFGLSGLPAALMNWPTATRRNAEGCAHQTKGGRCLCLAIAGEHQQSRSAQDCVPPLLLTSLRQSIRRR